MALLKTCPKKEQLMYKTVFLTTAQQYLTFLAMVFPFFKFWYDFHQPELSSEKTPTPKHSCH